MQGCWFAPHPIEGRLAFPAPSVFAEEAAFAYNLPHAQPCRTIVLANEIAHPAREIAR